MSLINAKVIATGYDAESYHKQDAKRGEPAYVVGNTDLGLIASNPRKWIQGYREGDSDTDATEWGSLVDTLRLDNARFESRYAVRPDEYPATVKGVKGAGEMKPWSGNAEWCKDWVRDQAPKTVLASDKVIEATNAVRQINRDANCKSFFEGAKCQIYCTGDYEDSATGLLIPVKILIDVLPDASHPDFGRGIGDLKTCRSAVPRDWNSACYKMGYVRQAALYMDVFTAATAEDRVEWYHVISENTPPYYAELRRMEEAMIELGRFQYRNALARYAQCLKTGDWPGYFSQTVISGVAQIERESWMVE